MHNNTADKSLKEDPMRSLVLLFLIDGWGFRHSVTCCGSNSRSPANLSTKTHISASSSSRVIKAESGDDRVQRLMVLSMWANSKDLKDSIGTAEG